MLEKTKLLSVGTPILAVFSILLIGVAAASAQTETVLYNFAGSPDGAVPQSPLISDGSGNFWCTTITGGENNYGSVFEITVTSDFIRTFYSEYVLWNFHGTDGAYRAYP